VSMVNSPTLARRRAISSSRWSVGRLFKPDCHAARNASRHSASRAAVTPSSRKRESRSSPRKIRSTTFVWDRFAWSRDLARLGEKRHFGGEMVTGERVMWRADAMPPWCLHAAVPRQAAWSSSSRRGSRRQALRQRRELPATRGSVTGPGPAARLIRQRPVTLRPPDSARHSARPDLIGPVRSW
jgi:hypothetical protein